jgi:CHAT domain-containing protein/uncharacterized protein HemY
VRPPRLLYLAACIAASGCAREEAKHESATTQFPHSASADSLLSLGESVYKRSEYDSANAILKAGHDIASTAGDSQAVARADTWLGLTAFKQGRYKDARRIGEQALAKKLRLNLREDLFRSYNALGLLAYNEGRYGDATQLLGKARASAEAVRDSVSIAKALGNLGMVHSEIGEFDLAHAEFTTLADVAQKARDTIPEANALSNLGMLSIRGGDANAAIDYLNRARALYSAVDYPAGIESVLGQMGSAYSDLGQPQRAIAYMDSAMSVARAHDLVREEAEDLMIYAELFGDAGDHTAALRHLERSRILADSAGLGSRLGDIARAQAREYASISRRNLALARAKDAISIHRKSGARLDELEDHLTAAEIAQSDSKTGEASSHLDEAGKISRDLSIPVADEMVALGSARVADLAGDPSKVLLRLPADLSFERLGIEAAAQADAMRARAFAKLRQWPEAVTAGRRAVEALRLVRESLGEGPLRSAYTSDKSDVYANLVVALLQLGRTSDAFEVADDARGKALLEHLNALKSSARSSSRDLSEADQLLRRIDYLTERLRLADTIRSKDRTAATRQDLSKLAARLTETRRMYEDRIATASRIDPRGASLLGATGVKATYVRKVLGPHEAIIEYLVTPDRLFTFVATRDTVVALTKAIGLEDLANRVRLATELSARSRTAAAGRDALRGLYDILIAPVDSIAVVKGATTFVLVPHSTLVYLPFAALTGKDGRPLIEERAILTLPSASALPYLRGQTTLSSASSVTSVFAPFPQELAGTREEALAVKGETRGARSFVGSAATESRLRSELERGGNVHIASHAVFNSTTPMFSHIELAAGRGGDPDDDGNLDLHELLRLTVRSDLVYLSGCETGVGAAWSNSFQRSQDYATLSQAILYAGAENVVATLWRIDDAGASVFAQRFYAALERNDVVQALAIAQRQTIRDPRYRAPRYWAAYTVSGSGLSSRNTQQVKTASVQ